MRGHVPLQLGAVRERVVAQGAGEVFLVLLMAVLDVLLQRCQALVASVAVGAGQQLGESIWRSRWQVCKEWKGAEKVSESMAADGRAARGGMGVIRAICRGAGITSPSSRDVQTC